MYTLYYLNRNLQIGTIKAKSLDVPLLIPEDLIFCNIRKGINFMKEPHECINFSDIERMIMASEFNDVELIKEADFRKQNTYLSPLCQIDENEDTEYRSIFFKDNHGLDFIQISENYLLFDLLLQNFINQHPNVEITEIHQSNQVGYYEEHNIPHLLFLADNTSGPIEMTQFSFANFYEGINTFFLRVRCNDENGNSVLFETNRLIVELVLP